MKIRDKDSWFDVIKLMDDLYALAEFGHFEEVISFLLLGEEEAILIDSGIGLFSIKSIVERITSLPCRVLNTHSHFDHVGSNHEFARIDLFDHPSCREAARSGFSHESISKFLTPEQFFGFQPRELPNDFIIPPFPQAGFFQDRDLFKIGPFELTVFHTPGHSDDSVCFYEPNKGWLFAGDLLYEGPIFIEREGGLKKYRESLRALLGLKKLDKILSAHNKAVFSPYLLSKIEAVLAEYEPEEILSALPIEGRLELVPSV